MIKEEDVCLVEFVGRVGEVEENCGMTPTFIMHNIISNVETMHMQATATHFCVVELILLLQQILVRLKLCNLWLYKFKLQL
jgi:hypothetical protein